MLVLHYIYWSKNDFVYVYSARFKHVDSSCRFLEGNCKWLNLNFLKLKHLLIDNDVESIESNPGPTQNYSEFPAGHPMKIKIFKGAAKKCDPCENNVNAVSDRKFFQYNSTCQLRY